jgi:hypothetical protein
MLFTPEVDASAYLSDVYDEPIPWAEKVLWYLFVFVSSVVFLIEDWLPIGKK